MTQSLKTIYVYDAFSNEEPLLMGTLYVEFIRKQETYAFRYDDTWLKETSYLFPLDPNLALFSGRQYPTEEKRTFGIFEDSAPDRWGRTLMDRRERIWAHQEGRKPRKLAGSDYLIGVYDATRIGALRFKLDKEGPFISDDAQMPTPPWTKLRSLEEAARQFEMEENRLEQKWIDQLIHPGSSLGGARPKASVVDADGNLWIAKFPSRYDTVNVGAWEKVVHDLARLCGLNLPESKRMTFSNDGDTFLVKRFDRQGKRRIHFASAMTMLGKSDGASATDGASYLDLAAFLKSNGASPKADCVELWRRIVFNIAVSNTDDHLRNHGFILTPTGWRLSPLYDINPVPGDGELSLCLNETDPTASIPLAIETAPYYGISKSKAEQFAEEICHAVAHHWQRLATEHGLSRDECVWMSTAFPQS